MGRSAGRSPEQTRRKLLDAAAAVVRTKGIAATLDDIAKSAGVSKGGLIYHFASKDELILALADDVAESFRTAVMQAMDESEPATGRLTRAYVRASFDVSRDQGTTRDDMRLAVQLSCSPEVEEHTRHDSERWEAELWADGLDEDVLTLVIAAADGVSVAPLWGGQTDRAHYQRLMNQLIAMTTIKNGE